MEKPSTSLCSAMIATWWCGGRDRVRRGRRGRRRRYLNDDEIVSGDWWIEYEGRHTGIPHHGHCLSSKFVWAHVRLSRCCLRLIVSLADMQGISVEYIRVDTQWTRRKLTVLGGLKRVYAKQYSKENLSWGWNLRCSLFQPSNWWSDGRTEFNQDSTTTFRFLNFSENLEGIYGQFWSELPSNGLIKLGWTGKEWIKVSCNSSVARENRRAAEFMIFQKKMFPKTIHLARRMTERQLLNAFL